MVLLQAGVADRSMRSDVLPLPGFRAIIPDLPGFGEAAVQPGPQAPWEAVLAPAPKRFAPLELILGVGHLAPMEDPEAFRSLLLRFLA